MDRLHAMSILVEVVERGSFSEASRKLGVPLTTVSRHVADLEAHLKTRLLNRSTRKLTLTDAGKSYIEASKRILEQVDAAERTATGEYSAPKGDLIITAPIVFGRLHILPIVTDFLKAYPDIDIRIMLTDRTVNLIEERIDIALRIGDLPDSSLMATRVGTIRQIICGSPAYFKARGIPKLPKDLSAHDCVTFESLAAPDAWTFLSGKKTTTVPVHSRLVVTTAEAAVDAAVAGVGITRVFCYQIDALVEAKKLTVILKDFEAPPLPASLVYLGGYSLPLKMRAFIDFAASRLKMKLQQS